MTESRELRDLVGDVSAEELEQLREIDALLRTVSSPPPPLPAGLAHPPAQRRLPVRWLSPARLALAAGLVAALALVSSAAVLWLEAQDDFDVRAEVALEATPNAPDAAGELRLGERDASGTWPLELTVSGLRELPPGDFYVLWLAKDGKYAGTCGSFRVTGGKTTHRWDVAYRLHDYDEWVISARHPGLPTDPRLHPWLLHARI